MTQACVRRKLTCYGLSIAGFLVCLYTNLPISYGHAELELDVTLLDGRGVALDHEVLREEETVIQWFWSSMGAGHHWTAYEACLARLMPRVRTFLAAGLRSYVEPSATTAGCRGCGAPVAHDARFCPACGVATALARQGLCGCGEPTPAGARFCGACGRSP